MTLRNQRRLVLLDKTTRKALAAAEKGPKGGRKAKKTRSIKGAKLCSDGVERTRARGERERERREPHGQRADNPPTARNKIPPTVRPSL